MSIRYLDFSGAVSFWTNIKNYILSKIPTKTSELTNDSGFLTQHQSLSNYVTLNSSQTITGIKTITGGNQGKMIFKNPNFTVGTTPESGTTVTRIYFGGGASYDGSTGAISNDIASNGNSQLEICALNNNSSSSYRASLILRYEQDQTRPRFIKSWGDFCPYSDNTYYLGRSDSVWKECYCNAYYLGTTAFGDIVTHNASEFLTSHQSLSSCVKNSVVNNQTIKSTGITRGTAPSSAQTFGIAFSDNSNKYIGNIYGQYATDKSTYVGLYAYKGTTTSNGDNAYLRIGYDASGNVYTSAPTPATADNSTQIATTAFVYNTAAKHLSAATNIYVAKVATGNGSGSNTSNYMALADLRTYLATVHMHSSASNMYMSYNLQILFKAGDSFGDATFDATKMPGVRNLILNTSAGTNSTVDNYSTNSPTFGNITVTGDISVTMRNLNCTGRISSQYGAQVSIDTYMGISSLQATNYGYLNVTKNMVINVCDAHIDYFCLATNNGILSMWPGATITINFRQQCYYTRSLFMAASNGTAWIGYSSFKLTGTEPMAVWASSGTLTGTSETAAATVEKAVTLASGHTFTLAKNATAKVKFTVDNTAANPTLNIGGTGAKPIYWNNAPVQAAMLMKNITYDVKYNGSQFVIQNAVKRLTNNDFGVFRSSGNYNQTYNSGSWNFTGWALYYGTGIENSNWRGSHIGNIQQNVSTSNNTYPVLISGTANATANTLIAPYFAKDVKINPSTNSVYATNFYENETALSSKYALNENFGKGTTTYLYIKATDFPTNSAASIRYNDVVDGTKLYVWYSVCNSSSILDIQPTAIKVTTVTGQVWRYLGPTVYATGLGHQGAAPTGILGLFRRES